ncbi:MAG: GAF domain-containing protein [Ktedonobacterales bacterium]
MPPSMPPPRSPVTGAAGHAGYHAPAQAGIADQSAPALQVMDIFADALDGAMALVHADGGAIALLDETRQLMVLRARRTRQRADSGPGMSGSGMPARPSQPLSPRSLPMPSDGLDDIDVQATQVLTALATSRTFRPGERLIGHCWQLGEPIVLTGEQCRALPAGRAPADPDAPHHLAVPILRPSSLTALRPHTEVMGVIAVYNKDHVWPFSPHHAELLALHADRVARALLATDLARQVQSQADLLTFLGSRDLDDQQTLQRLRDVVRRVLPAPSFAILYYDPRRDELAFKIAERDGVAVAPERLAIQPRPAWWEMMLDHSSVCVSTPEDHALHPGFDTLGFGGPAPVQSLLAAPLLLQNELRGVMLAASPRADVYGPEHLRLFTMIARTAALVIHTRLLADHKLEKELQLAKLNNALLTFNASLDLDTAVTTLAEHAAQLAENAVCLAFLLEHPDLEAPERGPRHDSAPVLVGHAASPRLDSPYAPLHQVRLPLQWQNLQAALDEGGMRLLDNLEVEWGDGTDVGRFLAEYRIRRCLVLPLVHTDEKIGVLLIYSPGQKYLGSPEEMGLLQGLASQGAVAIHNARLFRRLEEELDRRKELDRLKEDFILTVSHEFRTPVTAIEGYVTLIDRHGNRLDTEKLNRFAKEIHLAATQLTGMITKLNDVNSMEEAKQLELTPAPTNVRRWAEQATGNLAPEATARMMVDIPADLWAQADGERLGIIFSNLLSNALKYSPRNGPIRVTAWLESSAVLDQAAAHHGPKAELVPEQVVMVSVRDFGEGIPPEDIGRLFHKFVRLSRSLTTSVRGTGLGLWICKKYVEAMGGVIWVESEVGSGADFRFWLRPAAAPDAS